MLGGEGHSGKVSFQSQPTKGASYQHDLSALMLTLIAGLSYYLSVSFSSKFIRLKATFPYYWRKSVSEVETQSSDSRAFWNFFINCTEIYLFYIRGLFFSPFMYLTIYSTYTASIHFILCVPKQSKSIYFASDIVLILLFGTLNVFCFEYELIFWCGKAQDALNSFCSILFPSSIMSHLFKQA